MCGIVGFTHKDWIPDPERIRSATATLIHRGPDEQGVFESKIVSLGATRLKIIDLHGGDQPITAADAHTTIVFNGEIYNHLELRAELEKLGHHFDSHCDTETVLHAFLQWDTGCFSRLRGMFAIALWTESTRRLVLARDRMGIKPLYFIRRGEDLFFGSELKAILVHPEIERRLSLNGLDCFLSLNYIPSPWTLVEGIEKLPPGRWLEWRDGKVFSDSYWTLPLPSPREQSLESAKEELDALLHQSIREHMVSDVPLGMWLSGGIDSSTILHYAATESTSPLKTFSISFRGRSFDETAYIKEVASLYHTDHEQLDLNPECDLQSAIEEFAYYSDEPSADAGALPVWFLSKLSKTKTTVSLSGEGADELFAGYLTHRANQLAQTARRLPGWGFQLAGAGLSLWPLSDEKIGFEYKASRFLEGCQMPPERAHIHWNGTFADASKQQLLRSQLPPALRDKLEELRSLLPGDGLSPYLQFDQKYYLPDDILTKTDRMSMAHSLEVRPPFLDHRIVEFAATLPASLKIRGSRQKFILKELMKGKLPPSVLSRKKVGFDIPAHEWLRGPLRSLLVETLTAGAAEHAGLFDAAVIEAHMQRHLAKRANLGYQLWGLLVLFLWMKKWRIQTATAPAAVKDWVQEKNWHLYLGVLLVAGAVYLGCIVSPPSLMDDVDAVQAQIARNMLTSGDWVTARLDGVVYMEKAPLIYWAMALSYKVFGVHDWAARIPIALAVMGLAWLTAAFGVWAFGKRAGLYSGLCMATCIGIFLFTRILIPDVMITFTVALAMWAFLRALDEEEPHPRWWAFLLAASLGLGLLLKSLIGIVFPIAAGVIYLFVTHQLFSAKAWKRLHPFSGALIVIAIAAPWHILAALRNPPYLAFTLHSGPGEYHGFLWFFFINEQLLRFLNLRYPRDYDTVPRLYFWLFHLLWLFPWSVYFPAIAKLSFKPIDRPGQTRLLALCWTGFILVFFTFSTTQEYYSMPCYPALALLLGSALATEGAWVRRGTRVLTVVAGCAAIAGIVILFLSRGILAGSDISAALSANPNAYKLSLGHMEDLTLASFAYLRLPLAMAVLAFCLGAAGTFKAGVQRAAIFAALMMVLFFHAARVAMVAFDPYLSSRPLAKAIQEAPPGTLIIDHHYYTFSSIFFYTNRSAMLLNGRYMNLEYGAYAPGVPDVFIDDALFRELWLRPETAYVVAKDSAVPRLESLVGREQLNVVLESGGKFVLTNHPLAPSIAKILPQQRRDIVAGIQ